MKNEYFVRVLQKNNGIEITLFSKGMESKEQAENVKRMLEWVLLGDIDIVEKKTEEKVVHAKWFKKTKDHVYWMACSNCGGEILKNLYGNDYYSTYCPHCGAKMDDIDNGEEYE